jgi:PKD repeat protein
MYTIEFYTKYLIEDEWDHFVVQYTTDNGKNWKVLGEEVLDAANWHNQIAIDQNGIYPPGKPFFSGDTGGEFVRKTLDISFLSNQSTVAFRFAFKSDPASEEAGLAIDDFQITGPTSSTPAVAFGTDSDNFCISSVIEFKNSSVGDINSYSWNFGSGALPATAVGFGPHEVVYTTTGAKTVTLVASTDAGDLTETMEIEITSPPALLDAIFEAPGICKGDTAYISIADSEDGIFYQLYNVTNGIVPVGDPVVGTGGEIFVKSIVNTNSIFKVTAENSGGCTTNFEGVISIESKLKPTVTVSRSSTGILTASFAGADEYVWFLDGEVIEGANGQSYTPNEQGSFYVGASNGGCFGYSTQLVILSAPDNSSLISIYPNPTEGILVLDVEAEMKISLHDLSGRVIVPLRIISEKSELDISNLRAGYYLLKTEIGDQISTQKIYKK